MSMIKTELQYGNQKLTLETGRIARQAAGSVMVSMGKTTVLAAVTVRSTPSDQQFVPLTVHYQERFYAAGRIPGGFFRREGRPTERETLTSRLIDRALRPLFPKKYRHETLVVCTVLSADLEVSPDIPALIGASAALALSGIPFAGPVAAARIGIDGKGQILLNPSMEQSQNTPLDMVVAGTSDGVVMVESEARQLSETLMLEAVLFGHTEMQGVLKAIGQLAEEAGTKPWDWEEPQAYDQQLAQGIGDDFGSELKAAYGVHDRQQRRDQLAEIHTRIEEQLAEKATAEELSPALAAVERSLVREQILAGEPRIDGRDSRTVRPIESEVGILPCTHGSALFTRGETQAIGSVTLGTKRDAQMVDSMEGKEDDFFMLHYNFPPYSVGESGRMGPPGRREIGHGRLARRAVAAVLPSQEDFPYTVRLVSEITESNGSSSMATVCASSLAMMHAGVPVSAPVAGVAMGLVKQDERFVVLTDILGDEDHLGDMDFKVAGTANGVTALQMDIKIDGITRDIMEQALAQAQEARLHILEQMNKVIDQPRSEVADNAPAFETLRIPIAKIRDLIGKGGETIRALTAETNTDIDVDQDGSVRVYGEDRTGLREAVDRIRGLTAEAELGQIYEGNVRKIMDFGAFVNILPGKDGLVHISQIANERVHQVSDYLQEGQNVQVKVIGIDESGKVRLSMKEAMAEADESDEENG